MPKEDEQCALQELVQYHCTLLPDRISCKPIERIFQRYVLVDVTGDADP